MSSLLVKTAASIKIPSNYNKWIKIISQVILGQVTFQVLGLVISLILVRNMPKSDYAVYIVLMSIQAMLNQLSGSGILVGFKKIGGEIWNDDKALSSLIKTATATRSQIFLMAIVIANGYGFFILRNQGISIGKIFVFLLSVSITVIPEIQKVFIQTALHLKSEVAKVEWMSIINQAIRVVLILMVFLVFKRYLIINTILIITIISVWISYAYILKVSKNIRQADALVNPEYKKTLLHYIKLNWHNAAFYTFRGQISIFLLGVFGSSTSLANIGALSRFSLLFTVLSALISNVFLPAFGRQQNRSVLMKQFFGAIFGFAGLSLLILFAAYLLSDQLLWLLGKGYKNLNFELLIVFASSLIGMGEGLIEGLNAAKGWIKYNPLFAIPLDIVALGLGVYLFNVRDLHGVVYMGMFTYVIGIALAIANSWAGFKSYKAV